MNNSQQTRNASYIPNDRLSYVIITPAKNEEQFIEETIKSVIRQTYLPKAWVIISDGSTDRTDEIVQTYASQYPWMHYIRRPEHIERNFASKVESFYEGYSLIEKEEFDIIGNLDADLTFDNDYFEYLLDQFKSNANLGVAGTPFVEKQKQVYDYRFTNINHVSGACQLFRRECFASIGGYKPIKGGGIDFLAVTIARMHGWDTKTFDKKVLIHHRGVGSDGNKNNLLTSKYKVGLKDYRLGNHPLWELFRALYQAKNKPVLIGGILILIGYFFAYLKKETRPIPEDVIRFVRGEQMSRLKRKLNGTPLVS